MGYFYILATTKVKWGKNTVDIQSHGTEDAVQTVSLYLIQGYYDIVFQKNHIMKKMIIIHGVTVDELALPWRKIW